MHSFENTELSAFAHTDMTWIACKGDPYFISPDFIGLGLRNIIAYVERLCTTYITP